MGLASDNAIDVSIAPVCVSEMLAGFPQSGAHQAVGEGSHFDQGHASYGPTLEHIDIANLCQFVRKAQ